MESTLTEVLMEQLISATCILVYKYVVNKTLKKTFHSLLIILNELIKYPAAKMSFKQNAPNYCGFTTTLKSETTCY